LHDSWNWFSPICDQPNGHRASRARHTARRGVPDARSQPVACCATTTAARHERVLAAISPRFGTFPAWSTCARPPRDSEGRGIIDHTEERLADFELPEAHRRLDANGGRVSSAPSVNDARLTRIMYGLVASFNRQLRRAPLPGVPQIGKQCSADRCGFWSAFHGRRLSADRSYNPSSLWPLSRGCPHHGFAPR